MLMANIWSPPRASGRISFHRQPANVGIVENCNTCIRRARGQWVHILHGDDTVREDFYARVRQDIEAFPDVGAAFCRVIYMDETSQWTGLTEPEARSPGVLGEDFAVRQFLEQRIQFVAMVVRRSTYEEFGGLRPSLSHCVDWACGSASRCANRSSMICSRWPATGCTPRQTPVASSGQARTSPKSGSPSTFPVPTFRPDRPGASGARSHAGGGDPCGPPRAAAMERWRPCHSLAPAPSGHEVQPRACGSHPHGLFSYTCLLALTPAVDGYVVASSC